MKHPIEIELTEDETNLLFYIMNNNSSYEHEQICPENLKMIRKEFVFYSLQKELQNLNDKGKEIFKSICEKLNINLK